MAIRRLVPKPEVKLPPAVLYLDDLDEIIELLRPEGQERPPALQFIVDDQQCDTIDELRTIGGRARKFQMRVDWNRPQVADNLYLRPYDRARIDVGGPVKHQAWAMERIRDVFSRRGTWVGRYRRWLISVVIFVILVAFHFWSRLSDHLGLRESLRYIIEACVMLPGGYFFGSMVTRSFRSTLVLQRYVEHQGGWFKRNREKIEVAAVTSLITAIITTLVAAAIHGWFSSPPSH